MDETRFDQALRDFAAASGRRHALRSLSMAGLALLATLGLPNFGDARKKRKKKKRKKRKGSRNKKKPCKEGTKRCGKRCIPSTECCTSAECEGGSCVEGTCQCLEGTKACHGACIPEGQCCESAECDDSNPCTNNVCRSDGTCSNPQRPDLSYCGSNNMCSGGLCATYPACLDGGLPCVSHSNCCSNLCLSSEPFGFCYPAADIGEPCHLSAYCASGKCVGFVCVS